MVKVLEGLASNCTMRKTACSLVPISNYLDFIALNGELYRERVMGALEDSNQCSKGDLARMVDAREELPAEECEASVS